jgi:hypothetical protein
MVPTDLDLAIINRQWTSRDLECEIKPLNEIVPPIDIVWEVWVQQNLTCGGCGRRSCREFCSFLKQSAENGNCNAGLNNVSWSPDQEMHLIRSELFESTQLTSNLKEQSLLFIQISQIIQLMADCGNTEVWKSCSATALRPAMRIMRCSCSNWFIWIGIWISFGELFRDTILLIGYLTIGFSVGIPSSFWGQILKGFEPVFFWMAPYISQLFLSTDWSRFRWPGICRFTESAHILSSSSHLWYWKKSEFLREHL